MKILEKDAGLADALTTRITSLNPIKVMGDVVSNYKRDNLMEKIKSRSAGRNMAKAIAKPSIKADPGWLNKLNDDVNNITA